ncbi:MAG: ferredoxin--NADP reductase [Acidimicrobiia bacterium]
MGQRIQVEATQVGRVALFTLDRSLTGQDGLGFDAGPMEGGEPPLDLARRLFVADAEIDHVQILSNSVSVRRREAWDPTTMDRAAEVIAGLFTHYRDQSSIVDEEDFERLRQEHYNATLTHIRPHNEELWVMRVAPDQPIDAFQPGQYTTLALGYWEPRSDHVAEELGDQEKKLARRSYSVSSSIVDESGELTPAHSEDVEFYIVKVKPGQEEIPALTPRLFLKGVGDRLFMGRKFTGRYTLEGVGPTDSIVFLSTGTGEAPQNAMTAELLRRGHRGQILNAVTVRYRDDLGYTEQQAVVSNRYPNYTYLPLTTREKENLGNKVYIQDLLESGRLEKELGAPLDPANTHVFLCGNPSMIGLPKWTDDELIFPETLGVCQQLHDRGFTIDHGKTRGNVHYEEYWKDR